MAGAKHIRPYNPGGASGLPTLPTGSAWTRVPPPGAQVGAAKAVWTAAVPLAHLAWRLLVWSSPVLIWAFWKWVNW